MNLNQEGLLGEHPDSRIPGVEVDSGSLGHGLGIAAGLALSSRMDKKDNQTVVLLGDGECYEGSTWEAALFAAHLGLKNLFAIVDRNGQIVNDFTENVNRLEPLADKWSAFGWDVREINGHDFKDIFKTADYTLFLFLELSVSSRLWNFRCIFSFVMYLKKEILSNIFIFDFNGIP